MKTAKATPRVDQVFRAFSDKTRLRMLYLLKEGEACVGDLVAALRVDQPRVSRHLDYLKRAGLVSVRSFGTWRFYSLAQAQGAFHQKLLECLSCCFDEVPQLHRDAARAAKLRRAGGCCPELRATRRPSDKPDACC